MTTITIPTEIELSLTKAARQQGTTPELLAIESLRRMYAPANPSDSPGQARTLQDFLQGYVGTIEGVAEPLSENTGRSFTEVLQSHRPSKSS